MGVFGEFWVDILVKTFCEVFNLVLIDGYIVIFNILRFLDLN